MILTFAEDFTSEVNLDSELIGVPTSGLYWNRGVHPTLTVNNLLALLPILDITFTTYAAGVIYSEFNTSRKKSDVVLHEDKIYQSKVADNTGNTPATPSAFWLETTIESLRIKSFIWTVEDNALSALSLNRMLIENQYVYNIDDEETLQTIGGDFFGWVFEPKGSDYVTIRINQIAFQANTDVAQNLYVINQGRLISTIELNPQDGVLEFEQVDYSFSGKGRFIFATESQEVQASGVYNDPLRYKGFVCYPVTGIGATAEDSEYSFSSSSNGLNFNISCFLDSSVYIDNNKIDLAKFYQTQFEYDFMRMLVHNSNDRFEIDERIMRGNPELIAAESMDSRNATVARKYMSEMKRTIEVINRTFDKFLKKKQGLRVNRKVM
jgi:hypothetical protein